MNSMFQYNAIELIKVLQVSDEVNKNNLFKIEWGFYDLISGYRDCTATTIENKIENDPQFFHELVSYVYRSTFDKELDEAILMVCIT